MCQLASNVHIGLSIIQGAEKRKEQLCKFSLLIVSLVIRLLMLCYLFTYCDKFNSVQIIFELRIE